MKLHHLLSEDMIIPELESSDREGVIKEMVGFLKKKKRIVKEKELYEKLIQRESLGSTAIGEGFAIPHCKVKGAKSPLVALAVSKKGVNFESLDGKPCWIFFLVVSPLDSPSLNLQILAIIAQLVRKANNLIRRISEAKTKSEILNIIREEEEKA